MFCRQWSFMGRSHRLLPPDPQMADPSPCMTLHCGLAASTPLAEREQCWGAMQARPLLAPCPMACQALAPLTACSLAPPCRTSAPLQSGCMLTAKPWDRLT